MKKIMANPTHSVPEAGFLAAIVQSSADAIITKDLNGIITSWNKAAETLFGYTADEVIGRSVTMLIPDDRIDEEPGILTRIRRGEVIDHYDTVRKTRDGRLVDLSLTVSPIHDETGKVIGASKVARNITDRRRNEVEIARITSIIESSSDAIISKDLNGIIQSWNHGAELIFGYTSDEAVGKPVTMLMPEDRVNEEPGILDRIRRGERVDHYETVRRRKDGKLIDISLNVSPVRDSNGVIIGASKIARDITEHNKLQAAEREADIMHRLVETQELERRRIARDLHDQVGQHLTALRLTLENLRAAVASDPNLSEQLATVQDIARRIDADLSFLTWELRPTELEELGLRNALNNFVHEWSQHTGIEAVFEFAGDEERDRLSPAIETNLYRITQEALNNVAKHAGASRVAVLMHLRPNLVFMIIEDDGAGFDVSSPPPSAEGHGSGLSGMRERVELLKGKILIESSDKGTSIAVTISTAPNFDG